MNDSYISANLRKSHPTFIPNDLLNDLSSRFIINVPEEERVDLIRLCFQIELAHWFYLDFYCEENSKLPKVALKDFMRIIFGHIPFLQKYTATEVDAVIVDWREYKKAVPTFGAILLDQDLKNVLLVQSFVYKASWGFPKGKVNKDELPHHCAIREVLEETGFDITDLIDKEAYLEHYFNEQLIRLYIITGISPNAKFHPKTRNEIKGCEWFPVNQLPTGRKDPPTKTNLSPNSFFMVIPFVKQLRKWISNKISSGGQEKTFEADKQFLKQQQLFAEMTRNDLATYTENIVPAESKLNRPNKSMYSPPPRMLRQKNLRQVENDKKKKPVSPATINTERTGLHPKYHKKIVGGSPKPEKHDKEVKRMLVLDEKAHLMSKTWQNFSLDSEALVAIFNINLRKMGSPKKFASS